MLKGGLSLQVLQKLCFCVKARLPALLIRFQTRRRHHLTNLHRCRMLLLQFLPTLLRTNQFNLPLQPTDPIGQHVLFLRPLLHSVLPSDLLHVRGTAAILTTIGTTASTLPETPWFQEAWHGQYCRLGGASACQCRVFR
jgi:hypothetical protein